MTVKIKIKSLIHPALDALVQEYGLALAPLMPGIKGGEFYLKVQDPSYEARAALQTCDDVAEINDDHGIHEPI
jgi:hypothetical protein